ncbi:alpha/beta fold hydrolase [Zoogloea sp. G-4-1-14]|uniref:Alpha/beta fold hydrolase n=2 Tax=Zoogloea dura TaxID=2728840 RepID=A0A848G230_9RHOO|nr:alpha/beta fold hydrolase [Zoogloea dura]
MMARVILTQENGILMSHVPTTGLPLPGGNLDRLTHAQLAHLTGGISPAALAMAFEDWLMHLSRNPAEQAGLIRELVEALMRFPGRLQQAPRPPGTLGLDPSLPDRRFTHPGWQAWPFNIWSQSFLLTEAWWKKASTGVRGVSPHHENVVSFTIRQLLDLMSPANFLWTNPEVLERTAQTGGANLVQGLHNLMDDVQQRQSKSGPPGAQAFRPGHEVAVTPGQVIFRNHLIELIQYAPAGPQARPEPILIVPSWIMKYYILDLSPGNSLIRFLVDQGYTVFTISWANPGHQDRNLGMDDYLRLGVMDALDAVSSVVPGQRIHATGYCLGGTLLTIAAAAMGRDGDERLASLTMLAAQTDFTEPGELALFIDDSQVSFLEDIMWDQGYLDTTQMAGAFQLLNSRDLVWSRLLKDYLMGERRPLSDLMAWNADGTRLPYRMHTEYLRRLFLDNDLASGRYPVGTLPVALTDITCPIFCVATLRDHVAPWRSVHKLHLLADVPVTFLLSSGGHNVGIVNPPGVAGRSYQVLTRPHDGRYFDPEAWLRAAPIHDGSWWPEWTAWLDARSGQPVAAPPMGKAGAGFAPLCAAPGTHVLQT